MAASNVLYVEGDNDLHVLSAILLAHGFQDGRMPGQRADNSHYFLFGVPDGDPIRFRVVPNGTVNTLAQTLKVQLQLPSVDRVAVVADANSNPSGRWLSLRSVMEEAGYKSIPVDLPPNGLVLPDAEPKKIGVWLMPDNVSNGYLESLLCSLIIGEDSLWQRAKSAVHEIPEADRRFQPAHREKAELYTWLAWQQEPGKRMAEAVKAGYLDLHCAPAVAFLDWFRRWLNS